MVRLASEARLRQLAAMEALAATDAKTARLVEDVISALGLGDRLPEAARKLLTERQVIRASITAEVPLPPGLSYQEAVELNQQQIRQWIEETNTSQSGRAEPLS